MAKPYVQERQSEYWASRQIEEFFENYGSDVHVIPVPGRLEKLLPADFVFIPDQLVKLFGFQYKALYQESAGDFWKLESNQHLQLAKFPWIYYAMSELKNRAHKRNSLHLLRIFKPSSIGFPASGKFLESTSSIWHYRWGGFYKHLEACSCGVKINSEAELKAALADGYYDIAADLQLFVHNFATGRTISINPMLRKYDQEQDGESND